VNKELATLKSEISEVRASFNTTIQKVEDLSANPEKATTIENKISEIECKHSQHTTSIQKIKTKQLSNDRNIETWNTKQSTRLDIIQFQLERK
jgi:hypothetical protein